MGIKTDWNEILEDEFQKDYFKELKAFLLEAYENTTVYPKKKDLLTALDLTSFADTRVVILGQDPYHGPNQAHGLSFSVASNEAKFPPSLRNIFKELESDIGVVRSESNLTDWAEQGVLLLNTVFTVEHGKAGSHRKRGWEKFSTRILEELNKKEEPILFVLWGNDARSKKAYITNPIHEIIENVHPSPLSAHGGFFGSKPFSQINAFLEKNQYTPIIWG